MTKIKNRFKAWFLSRKLNQKVKLIFSITILVYTIIIGLFFNFVIKLNIYDYIKRANYDLLLSIGNNLNNELENLGVMSQAIMNSQDIVNYLHSTSGTNRSNTYKAIQTLYDITTAFDQKISSVYVFNKDGQYIDIAKSLTIVDREIMANSKWNKPIIDKAGFYELRINGDGAFSLANGEPVISFMRIINDLTTQRPIGLLVINISMDFLEKSLHDIDGEDRLFGYYDYNGNLLYGNHKLNDYMEDMLSLEQEFFTKKIKHNQFIYRYSIPNFPLVLVEYEKFFMHEYFSIHLIWLIIIIILLTYLGFMLISLFFSISITRPISKLVSSMEQVKQGWLKRVSINLPDDEIGHLKDSYNTMLLEINQLIDTLVEKEKVINQSKLEVMLEQINPHFLYNTLETIGYMSLESPREKVYEAIESLGNFYRRFLNNGSEEISIKEEVEIVKNYLKLQKLRYGNIFTDEYIIQEDLFENKVLKLILQPLVENSLYHGIRPKGEIGKIKITISSEQDWIYINVYDTGVGMSNTKIEQFMTEKGKSFGLRKTIQRLQTYYGIDDIYRIKSKVGCFCEVVLKLPKRKGDLDV